jgi:hypothetical protein
MRRYTKFVVVAGTLAALAVPTAAMAAGNSGNAQACQQGGWQNLVRQDGTGFTSTGDCVSYAANGGVLNARPTGGSENFSEDYVGSTPTSFSGGTIDSGNYAPAPSWDPSFPAGGILAAGPYFNGFAPGAHFLFTGIGQNTAKMTFTNAVKSVQLQAENDKTGITAHLTLTGYDAAGNVVKTTTQDDVATGVESVTLQIASPTANIKSFTISTDDGGYNDGLGFTNIVWS